MVLQKSQALHLTFSFYKQCKVFLMLLVITPAGLNPIACRCIPDK